MDHSLRGKELDKGEDILSFLVIENGEVSLSVGVSKRFLCVFLCVLAVNVELWI